MNYLGMILIQNIKTSKQERMEDIWNYHTPIHTVFNTINRVLRP